MSKEQKRIKTIFINSDTNQDQNINAQIFKETIMVFFANVPDPRVEDNCCYSFIEIITIMVLAIFCGADTIIDISRYSNQNKKLWNELFDLDFVSPSYNTFWWILTRMDPRAFAKAFTDWTQNSQIVSIKGAQFNIDGKSLRGARNKKGNCNVHIVHAWAHDAGLLIGQLKTDEKSNEIKAIPILLKELDINGAVISIDAAGCQKKIVDTIVEGGGDYFLAVKDNQSTLYNEMKDLFDDAHKDNFEYVENADRYEHIEKGHGRIVTQKVAIIGDVEEVSVSKDWKNIQMLIEITNETITTSEKEIKKTIEKRYYISSLLDSAKKFGERSKNHWSVESTLHWTLDVVFREDASRSNTLHSAVNLGTLRRAVLNVIKSDPKLNKMGPAAVRGNAKWCKDGSYEKMFIKNIFNLS